MSEPKYRRCHREKSIDPPIAPNEVRITAQGNRNSYITYALTKLDQHPSIMIKAMGRALSQAVTVAEIVKRRVIGLHQITSIDASEITDTWEPLEEGLKTVVTVRKVPSICIQLSKEPLDTANPGYQPPLPSELVKTTKRDQNNIDQKEETNGAAESGADEGEQKSGQSGRGRGRGARANNPNSAESGRAEQKNEGGMRNNGGNRGRGRGRGGAHPHPHPQSQGQAAVPVPPQS